jgi:hypothetical protein
MIRRLLVFIGLSCLACATFRGANPSLLEANGMQYWNLRMHHVFPKGDNPGFRLYMNIGAPVDSSIAAPYNPDTLNFIRLLEISGPPLSLFEIKIENNFKIGLNISDRCNYDKTMHKERYLGYSCAIPYEFLGMMYDTDTLSCIFSTFEHQYEWKWSDKELKKYKMFFEMYITKSDSIHDTSKI